MIGVQNVQYVQAVQTVNDLNDLNDSNDLNFFSELPGTMELRGKKVMVLGLA